MRSAKKTRAGIKWSRWTAVGPSVRSCRPSRGNKSSSRSNFTRLSPHVAVVATGSSRPPQTGAVSTATSGGWRLGHDPGRAAGRTLSGPPLCSSGRPPPPSDGGHTDRKHRADERTRDRHRRRWRVREWPRPGHRHRRRHRHHHHSRHRQRRLHTRPRTSIRLGICIPPSSRVGMFWIPRQVRRRTFIIRGKIRLSKKKKSDRVLGDRSRRSLDVVCHVPKTTISLDRLRS